MPDAKRQLRQKPKPKGPLAEALFGVFSQVLDILVPEVLEAAEEVEKNAETYPTECPLGEKAAMLYSSSFVTANLLRSIKAVSQIAEGMSVLFNAGHHLRLLAGESAKGETIENTILKCRGTMGGNLEHPQMLGQSFRLRKMEGELKAAIKSMDAAIGIGTLPARKSVTLHDIEEFRNWLGKNRPELLDAVGHDETDTIPLVPGPTLES